MAKLNKQKIIKWYWVLILFPFAALFLMLGLVWLVAPIPSFEELEHPNNKLATQVISADGVVLATFHVENRTYVPYEEISQNLVNAAVATEDSRFYRHSGIDFRGLGRVLFKTILLHDSGQGGGSTISQQLAKTLYPRQEVKSNIPGWSKVRMVWTKMKEWITAIKIERNYTKKEIVAMYLNSIFFGSGAYGVKAASETFFAKSPSDVTLEEAATLIGMVNKPTRYNPVLNPGRSLERRNFVIRRVEKANYITKSASDSIQKIPITLSYQIQDHNSGLAPYFRDKLRRDMYALKPRKSSYSTPEDFTADSLRWVNDDIYGWLEKNKKPTGEKYNLDKDGLKIYTTVNSHMQKYAEEAVCEWLGGNLQKSFDKECSYNPKRPFSYRTSTELIDHLMMQSRKWSDRYRYQRRAGVPEDEILAQFNKPVEMRVFSWNRRGYVDTTLTPDDSIRYYKGLLRTGFVAMEPGSGHILAYVGGPNYRYFKYDNVGQSKRQVGSTIKPFLYSLAMQEGLGPCHKVVNLPQTFLLSNGATWTPRSTDRLDWIGKTVTLRWGLTHSSNNISAYLMGLFGPAAMIRMMRQMGISCHLDDVYSLCVGPADISPLEMVAAYNTFPSMGVYSSPLYVTKIEDNQGNVLSEPTNSKKEAIGEKTAYMMIDLMKGVVNQGTGGRLRSVYHLKGEIAGKTGTTNDNSDGWFIGYTPKITAGIWVGGEDRQIHFNSTALGGGSNMALPIWGLFMQKCLADPSLDIKETDQFVRPAGAVDSGGCDGGDIADTSTQQTEEQYYFE